MIRPHDLEPEMVRARCNSDEGRIAITQAHAAAAETVVEADVLSEFPQKPRFRDLGLVRAVLMNEGASRARCEFSGEDCGGAVVNVLVQLAGTTICEDAGRRTIIGPGQWAVRLRRSRFVRMSSQPALKLSFTVPTGLIADCLAAFDDVETLPVMSSSAASRLFVGYVESLADEFGNISYSSARYGSSLIDFLRSSLGTVGAKCSAETVLLARAKRLIQQDYHMLEFSVASLAEALGCSPRTLNKAFNGQRHTPSQLIAALRLQHARCLLNDEASFRLPVARIAALAGFRDAAYFSRAYKQRFGETPTRS